MHTHPALAIINLWSISFHLYSPFTQWIFLRPTPEIILPVKHFSICLCQIVKYGHKFLPLWYVPSFLCNVVRLVLPSGGGYLFPHPLSLGWSGDLHWSTECCRSDDLSLPNWSFKKLYSFCFYSPGILLSRDWQLTKYIEHISNNLGHMSFHSFDSASLG